jgi:hypothetical protein
MAAVRIRSRHAVGNSDGAWTALWLGVALIAGIGVRVWLLRLPTGALDSDEAVAGLIARHAMFHHEFRAFYWGQYYGGTAEPLLGVPLFAVFGATVATLKALPLLLSALASVLVWRVGRRTVGEMTARCAACAFFCWPTNFLWLSTKTRGFYWVDLVVGLGIWLVALRIVDRPGRVSGWMALGLLAGIGLWTSPQVIYFGVPAAIWLVYRLRGEVWRVVFGIGPGIAGAAPWLWANLFHGMPSLHRPPFTYDKGYLGNAKVLATHGVPVALGLNAGEHWLLSSLVDKAVYLVALVAVAAAVVIWRRTAGLLLGLAVVSFALLWGIFPVSGVVGEGRYVLALLPALALLLWSAGSGHRVAQTLLLLAAVLLSVAGVSHIRDITAPNAPDVPMPRSLGGLIPLLQARGFTAVYANYWVAYRLDFESHERIIATPPDATARYGPYRRQVAASPHPVYVFVAGSGQDPLFAKGLRALSIGYDRFSAGHFIVYAPATPVDWFEVFRAAGS